MSLVNLAHVCSHLQNASRARLGTTSIPLTNLHLRLAQQMHKAGFFGSVTIAGKHQPPQPGVFSTHPDTKSSYTTTIPAYYKPNPAYQPGLAAAASPVPSPSSSSSSLSPPPEDFDSSSSVSAAVSSLPATPDLISEPYLFVPEEQHNAVVDESLVTQESVASRRLWLGLKYYDNRPVLEHMRLISKPTRRIWAGSRALGLLARGSDWGMVRGCRQIGECIFVTTDRGILEVRECVVRGVGGMLLLRVW